MIPAESGHDRVKQGLGPIANRVSHQQTRLRLGFLDCARCRFLTHVCSIQTNADRFGRWQTPAGSGKIFVQANEVLQRRHTNAIGTYGVQRGHTRTVT